MNKTKTKKTLYQVFSKNFSLDKNYDYGFELPEGLDDNRIYENLYYFIPDHKIIYGLKFHKFFLRHSFIRLGAMKPEAPVTRKFLFI